MALVLSLKIGDVIKIGDAIVSVVSHPSGNRLQYRILIDAPKDVIISRTDVKIEGKYDRPKRANKF